MSWQLGTENCRPATTSPGQESLVRANSLQIVKEKGAAFQPRHLGKFAQFNSVQTDNDGNVLTDGTDTFTWDVYGKMRSEQAGSSPTLVFTRDAFGHAVEDTYNGSYLQSFLGIGQFVSVMTGQTSVLYQFPTVNGSFYQNGNGGTLNYRADWLGSIRAWSGYTGASLTAGISIAPFGEYYNIQAGYGVSNSKFTGQANDGWPFGNNNVTHFFPERNLRASQGRWNSPDPAGLDAVDSSNPQSWNRYAYVLNNPLSNIDPTGLDCVYLNDQGTGAEDIDHASAQGECWGHGGYWADGLVPNGSWVKTFSDSDNIVIGSIINGTQAATIAGSLNDGGTAFSQMFLANSSVDTIVSNAFTPVRNWRPKQRERELGLELYEVVL